MEDKINIDYQFDVDAHIHMNWFEVEKLGDGVVIMCQDGCRRMLKKNGEVFKYNKKSQLWENL